MSEHKRINYSSLISHHSSLDKDVLVLLPAADAAHITVAIAIKQSLRFVELHEEAGGLGRFFPPQNRVGLRVGSLTKEEMIEHGGVMHLAVMNVNGGEEKPFRFSPREFEGHGVNGLGPFLQLENREAGILI